MIPRRIVGGYLDPSGEFGYTVRSTAEVAELADAHDSKSCSVRNVGSIPTFGTEYPCKGVFYFNILSPKEESLTLDVFAGAMPPQKHPM